jgi:transposase-like protein
MDDERITEQGQHLSEELAEQRQRAGRQRWRCPVDLRARIVAYAVTCSADGESHRRIADRLGMTQRTLSRWIRRWRQTGAGLRQVAIVSAEHRRTAPPASPAPLRLVSPHGYVIEGLDPELLVSLLQVLG